MHVVKIRRVGNSNVVSLPAEFEEFGFAAGTPAAIERQQDGSLRLVPLPDLREQVAALARRTVRKNTRALAILEAHDREEAPRRSRRRPTA